MLYILPPPRAPNPPSPWNSILCTNNNGGSGGGGGGNDNNNSETNDKAAWDKGPQKRPPKARLRDFLVKKDDSSNGAQDDNMDSNRNPKSLSECYFAGKGTALVLPAAVDAQKSNRNNGGVNQGSNIQKHLQSMFYLLRPEETLKMAVKLESVHPSRTRYLVVVSRMGARAEESCLLGIDCNDRTTVGLVLRVMADTTIRLDGDGGFSVSISSRHHIFKPVSVQAMWSALQTLHKVSSKARQENYYQTGLTHGWVNYYEERIESERSCLNEWHAMDDLESKRPPSPDSIRTKPTEREETERVIRTTLKEIMMSVDLDEVTSKYIRGKLEEDLDMDLGEYKSFIDQEMLTILGQMDAPTEIFDHVYLGSEWNASNYEELQRNGVGHILNVTREIDNFFPGTFDYLNVRVYDDEKTDLLKHWDDTFKYITKAKMNNSKVLVHCKMGVSRSASVVIAYAMKAYNWDFQTAMHHVKEKRTCIKPNTNFLSQLETYQGILHANKNKQKLQRSKSETNLKSPGNGKNTQGDNLLPGSEPTPATQVFSKCHDLQTTLSGQDLRNLGSRPKSWSPDVTRETGIQNVEKSPVFLSLEDLSQKSDKKSSQARNVLLPCVNGESYSVSPNQIVHLPAGQQHQDGVASVKERVNELESNKDKKMALNLSIQFEPAQLSEDVLLGEKTPPTTWDPGDVNKNDHLPVAQQAPPNDSTSDFCDNVMNSQTVWTSSTIVKNLPEMGAPLMDADVNSDKVPESLQQTANLVTATRDPFSNQVDKVFDREEKKQQRISVVPATTAEIVSSNEETRECPSRQSSWSSYDSAVVLGGNNEHPLSRHSSWGSGDTRTLPSRNSSWGSYDMRPKGPVHYVNEKGEKILHPSNSELFEVTSSGIFPYDKEDIPWHPGTVKRTKQKLEESNAKNSADNPVTKSSSSETLFDYGNPEHEPIEAINQRLIDEQESDSHSAISDAIDISSEDDNKMNLLRLSVSAPVTSTMDLASPDCSLSKSASNVSTITKDYSNSVINTAQCSSVKQHRTFLENLRRESSSKKQVDKVFDTSKSGLVKSLKKEFEAKTCTNIDPAPVPNPESGETKKTKGGSLPSSPVISHHQDKMSRSDSKTNEDRNFRSLLGLFEKKDEVHKRPKVSAKAVLPRNARYSCFEVSVEKSPIRITQTQIISNLSKTGADKDEGYKRPPISPVVRNNPPNSLMVAATVIAKAAKKQQQFGKSHPLARLNIKPRHNNPVYNTM